MAYPYRKPYQKKAPSVMVDLSTPKARPTFTPSAYQSAIREWLLTGKGNATIVATAGSGKTSTLVMLAFDLPTKTDAIFLAFGKAIADELSTKLPFPASTFHSLCNRAVRSAIQARARMFPQLDARKVDSILDRTYGDSILPIRSAVARLVGLAKNECLMPNASDDDISILIDRHDISWDSNDSVSEVCTIVRSTLLACTRELATIDFDDMMWLVPVFNLTLDKHDVVMVDEAQDTNPLQRDILRRLMGPSSRLIAVGDHSQAIYGFRGASNDALEILAREFGTVELPLTVSYRCPTSVVAMASAYGVIEAAPNAREGTVARPATYKFSDFASGDLVLCRNTAPLVTLAYRLLARRIPARIKGRDIGNGLKALIVKLVGKRGTLDSLPDKLSAYQEREVSAALAKRQENKAQAIADKCESIIALVDSMTEDDRSRGIDGLLTIIDGMFTDRNETDVVFLSTVHKSKGLERQRVTILDWHLMPSKMARQEWQQKQERNLQFVAITRSQDVLTFIDSETIKD